MEERKTLTTKDGYPIADNDNSLTAGPRGPVVIHDFHLQEKLAHFNRERIPERVVHAKGAGAFGTFTVTKDITQYTKADLFGEVGKQTPILARFSTVGGSKGSADTERDPRGFAVKFYTEEGNWDMVGNNTPVFFIRDPLKFPDFIHTQKRCPANNLKDPLMRWDYWSKSPEALHQVTILYSDRGIPKSHRHMNGYGSHTYSFINEENQRVWVKFHFKTKQGIENFTEEEAAEIKAKEPDFTTQDLWDAIDRGDYPQWRFCIQVMTEEQAENHPDNPFDLTKVWKHSDYPLIEVGTLELNRNPENYFAQIEQAAFSPSAIVPGIGFSPDKTLLARVMSYADAHRYRLGTNYQQLPVNLPQCPFATYQRDGAMAYGDNGGSTANYEPNSDPSAPKPNADYQEPPLPLGDVAVDRYDHRQGNDEFSQAGDLYRLMPEDAKQRLVDNIVGSLGEVPQEIQEKQLWQFHQADSDYGNRVAKGLGIKVDRSAPAT
ncbi:catalase [Oscillatoriales cyanobacterium LEGE 11467]|uniref:Catalase n=1 Tax=Zarconia navalis LEGE 11467 TaxID=1828826 RepID=A0A928Z9K9_9CYAN|nr:catalase [Zarconia navalis]MBE9040871.1 catalase [Zarconia navalis LEGE 11467]